MCERAQIPMFSTQESSAFVIDVLRAYLSKHFADRTTMHGVFMDILGLGVLITGESGLGKSELALELISRGHGLVADDAGEFSRIAPGMIEGHCPPLLQNRSEEHTSELQSLMCISYAVFSLKTKSSSAARAMRNQNRTKHYYK